MTTIEIKNNINAYINRELNTNESNWSEYYITKYRAADLYVSDGGLLARIPHNGDKATITVPTSDRNGYLLGTGQNRGITTPPVHQIVWDYFGDSPVPAGYVIDHINEIKTDNSIANLQLLTIGQNVSKSLKGAKREGNNNPNSLAKKALKVARLSTQKDS